MIGTFRQEMEKKLVENGMFPEHARDVMDKAEESENLVHMKDLWNDSIAGYPPFMVGAVYLAVKEVAVDWIKEKMPKTFFRPLFDDAYAQEIGFTEKLVNSLTSQEKIARGEPVPPIATPDIAESSLGKKSNEFEKFKTELEMQRELERKWEDNIIRLKPSEQDRRFSWRELDNNYILKDGHTK